MNLYTTRDGAPRSEIANTDFFLAANGRESPADEFHAFRTLFLEYQASGAGADILCLYPVRYSYFAGTVLPDRVRRVRPACPQYEKIFRTKDVKSLSLVFATGFFGNPSSYYGHVLLKANYDEDASRTGFLDTSVNYGADITDSTSSIFYIFNGLTGGYTAAYKPNNYFLHSHNYVNSELRDIWSYELALTDAQVRVLLEHSWEMMHARFDYFFLNDNCANRIGRLLEFATGKTVDATHGLWLMPFQIIRQAQAQGLIRREMYTPSLRTRFEDRYEAATESTRDELLQRLRNKDLPARDHAIDPEAITLALDHYDVEIATLSAKDPAAPALAEIQAHRQQALIALGRQKNLCGTPNHSRMNVRSPLLDLAPSMAGVAGQFADGEGVAILSYRGAHNDVLNAGSGALDISQFVMGSLEIEARPSRLNMPQLILIDIGNYAASPLPLDVDTATSWSLSLGYDRFTGSCSSCSVPLGEAKIGLSRKIGQATMFSMAGGRVQGDYEGSGIVAGVGEAGLVMRHSSNLRWQARARYQLHPLSGTDDLVLSMELSWRFGNQLDLRFGLYNEGDSDRAVAGLRYHFD